MEELGSQRTFLFILNQQRGLSLVDMLVSLGVVSIVMGAMATMLSSQQREISALQQKSETVELSNALTMALANTAVCTAQLTGKVIDVSGVTTLNESPTVINLGAIYQGIDSNSAVIAKADTVLPISNYGVTAERVEFGKIKSTGNVNEYVGNFEVSFARSSLVRSLKPVVVQQVFKTTTLSGITRIDRCVSSMSPSVKASATTCTKRFPSSVRKVQCGIAAYSFCLSDEVAIGGGSISGANQTLETAYPAIRSDGTTYGWIVIWYAGGTNCGINVFPNGSTAPASNPCFGSFCGSSVAYCCKK